MNGLTLASLSNVFIKIIAICLPEGNELIRNNLERYFGCHLSVIDFKSIAYLQTSIRWFILFRREIFVWSHIKVDNDF